MATSPGPGPNTCPGRLLGRPHRLLAIWTELAVLTHAPVFLVFCTHAPGGRFSLEFEPMGWLRPGEEQVAVSDYLKQLESRIANSPADAVAHLVWPCHAPKALRESGSPPGPNPPQQGGFDDQASGLTGHAGCRATASLRVRPASIRFVRDAFAVRGLTSPARPRPSRRVRCSKPG